MAARVFLQKSAGRGVNCGNCRKCKEVQVALYALGKLERYSSVFDVDRFRENCSKYIAYILANQKNLWARQVLQLVQDNDIPIKPEVLRYQKQFERVSQIMKRKREEAF